MNGNWMAARQMNMPQKQPEPAAKVKKASHSANPVERKRAVLAKTLKGMSKGGDCK